MTQKKKDITVKVINLSKNNLPEYETKGSAGMDIRADFSRIVVVDDIVKEGVIMVHWGSNGKLSEIIMKPGSRMLIPTGLKVEIPVGYEIQVRPRSGLAIREGLTVLNTPGTIDSDYRGEIQVIMINHGIVDVTIKDAERVGQIVLKKVERISWEPVEELEETERGEGGFGHSGKD